MTSLDENQAELYMPVRSGLKSDNDAHQRNRKAVENWTKSPFVSSAKIQNAAIESAHIGNAVIQSVHIENGTIQTIDIGDAQITTAKIGDAQITTAKIGDAQITNAHITDLSADKITAGTMDATVVMAGLLATAEAPNQRYEIDSFGIRGYDENGQQSVSIPTSSTLGEATFRGYLEGTGLLVTGNMVLRGDDNRFEQGSVVTLGAATANPSTAPTLESTWSKLLLQGRGGAKGLFWDSTNSSYWTMSGTAIYEHNGTTGAQIRAQTLSDCRALYGIARVGTRVYVLMATTSTAVVTLQAYNESNLNFLGSVNVESAIGVTMGAVAPTLGDDGSNVIVVWVPFGGGVSEPLRFSKFTRANTPAYVSTTSSSGAGNPNFSVSGNTTLEGFVQAESKWWVLYRAAPFAGSLIYNVEAWSTAGVFDDDEDWKGGSRGLTDRGGTFRTFDGSFVWTHTDWTWTTESPRYWCKYTWVDDSAHNSHGSRALTAGDFESAGSPTNHIDHQKRSTLTITVPSGPSDATYVGIYLDRGSTEPASLDYVADAAATAGLPTTTMRTSFTSGGAAPPTTTNMGGGANAEFQSEDGSPLMRANGYPRIRVTSGTPTANNPVGTGADEVCDWVNSSSSGDTGDVTEEVASDRIQLNVGGQWLVIASCQWDSGATIGGYVELHIELSTDGAAWTDLSSIGLVSRHHGNVAAFITNEINSILSVGVDDYLRLVVHHTSTGNRNLAAWNLSLLYLGPS